MKEHLTRQNIARGGLSLWALMTLTLFWSNAGLRSENSRLCREVIEPQRRVIETQAQALNVLEVARVESTGRVQKLEAVVTTTCAQLEEERKKTDVTRTELVAANDYLKESLKKITADYQVFLKEQPALKAGTSGSVSDIVAKIVTAEGSANTELRAENAGLRARIQELERIASQQKADALALKAQSVQAQYQEN